MSRRWTAECWMGSASGYVDIEVSASTINGAKEQLQNVYGAEQIRNLREIRGSSGGSDLNFSGGSGGTWLLGLLGASAAFLYLTPWVLMLVYGMGSAWVAEKITGQSIEEYGECEDDDQPDESHNKALAVILSAVIFGGVGFVQGTFLHKDLMNQYGTSEQVEEVRDK
jgi:hypothetical protein